MAQRTLFGYFQRLLPAREDIFRSIEAAERLLESGFSEASFLLAWSAVEATVRLLTKEENIVLDRLTPLYILKQAVMNGVISRDEYGFLTKIMEYRNALVHGFKPNNFDPTLVKELISAAKRLVQSATVP